jgi:signal transduction histidine kinase
MEPLKKVTETQALLSTVDSSAVEMKNQRTESRLRAVLEIGRALSTTLSPDRLLARIMDKVTELMEADRSTLFLVNQERKVLLPVVQQGENRKQIQLPFGHGVAGCVAETGETVNLEDAYDDHRFVPDYDEETGYRTRSMLTMPLHNQVGQVMGVIQVLNKRGLRSFDQEDVETLRAISAQAAIFLENAQLYRQVWEQKLQLERTNQELQRHRSKLDVLYEIEQEMNLALDLDDLLDRILRKAITLVRSEAGAVVLKESRSSKLYYHSCTTPLKRTDKIHFSFGEGFIGSVALQKKPRFTNDPNSLEVFDPALKPFPTIQLRSLLCVPLLHEGETIGVVELLNRGRDSGFNEQDSKLLEMVASSFSRAIHIALDRLDQEKQQRLATIGQLLSELVHDLKGPLTVINGYSQMITMQDDQDMRNTMGNEIQKQVQRLLQMTGEVLSFARGDSTLLIRKIKLNHFIKDVEDLLAQEFEGRDVEYELHAHYLGEAYFDETKIQRLIYNLSRNAHQAMSGGGRYVVHIRKQQEELWMEFEDTGSGIPAKLQPLIFESFVKGNPNRGTGLGLAIVKKIVDEHHGRIWFESEEGKGTTFFVALPIEPQHSSDNLPQP